MKLAILGCGKIANRIAKSALLVDSIDLVGFGSKDINKAKEYSKTYGCRDYGDYDHFFNSDIDAVYIATYNPGHYALIKEAIRHHKAVICEKPMVLDADALNIIAENPAILKSAKAPVIITPHPAEMGRLCGRTAKEVNQSREQTARQFTEAYGVITVLKGKDTVIAAPGGKVLCNPTGNSGMATGGSGDVLAGMCGSLLAQGAEPFQCAAAAVYLHGLAGDFAARRLGKASMLPTDIIAEIPNALQALTQTNS